MNTLAHLQSNKGLVPENLSSLMTSREVTIEHLEKVERQLQSFQGDNTTVKSTFANGIYVRQCIAPAGTFLIGAIQRTEHIAIMAYGHMMMWTAGQKAKELNGYWSGKCQPGVKRASYTFKETMFITCHKSLGEPKDDEDIRRVYTFRDSAEMLAYQEANGNLALT